MDSDTPQPVGEVIEAAQQALRLGDLALGERLARSALERSGELAARLPLAQALAFQGRGREADAVLAGADPAALSEPELIAWTLLRAANEFFMLASRSGPPRSCGPSAVGSPTRARASPSTR